MTRGNVNDATEPPPPSLAPGTFCSCKEGANWTGTVFRHAVRGLVLNLVLLGSETRRLSGNEQRAEPAADGCSGDENLTFFGVSQNEADAMFAVFGPIAEDLGLRYEWWREGDTVRMTFEQAGG